MSHLLSLPVVASLAIENIQIIYNEDDQLELNKRNYSYTEKELLQVANDLLKEGLSENVVLLAQSFSRNDILEEIANRQWGNK